MTIERTLESIRVDVPVPPHVPKDRVVDLTWAIGHLPNDLRDPYAPCRWLSGPETSASPLTMRRNQALPKAPCAAGDTGSSPTTKTSSASIPTTSIFSNKGTAEFQALIGETFRSIPLAVDPPEHGKYRMYLMPDFSPARLKLLEPRILASW